MALQQQQQQQVERIRRQLQATMGVSPCEEWLTSCVEHVFINTNSNTNSSNDKLISGVLHQLLHSDLRDVIRKPSSISTNENLPPNNHAQSLLLKLEQAIRRMEQHQSNACRTPQKEVIHLVKANANNNNSSNSPQQQRQGLMVQIEEVVDVSKSTEARMADWGPNGRGGVQQSNHPNNNNNYRNGNNSTNRCLKLCLSHGHGTPSSLMTITAMEESPLPLLSAKTPAGCKLLLSGTLVVRQDGMLLLHPGNATVIGGSVTAMVQTQQVTMQKAHQTLGVGVDPTVRALIGTGGIGGDDVPEDEREEASGDVQAAAPAIVTPAGAPARMTTTNPSARMTNTSNPSSLTSLMPPPGPRQHHFTTGTSTGSSINNNSSSNINTARGGMRTPVSPYSSSSTAIPMDVDRPTTTTTTHVNRYAAGRMPNNTPSTILHAPQQNSMPRTSHTNPYSTASSSSVAGRNSSNNPSLTPPSTTPVTIATITTTSAVVQQTRPNPPPITPVPFTVQSAAYSTGPTAAAAVPIATTSSSSSRVQNMTFSNLRKLLMQLVQNRVMYESYANMTFHVSLQQDGNGGQHFNIVKNPNYSKKKKNRQSDASTITTTTSATTGSSSTTCASEKYEMLLTAHFWDQPAGSATTSSSHRVACRLDAAMIASRFSKTATELRALSRTNRAELANITDEGGAAVSKAYFGLRTWRARLYPSAEEVFGTAGESSTYPIDDKTKPILLLTPQEQ